MSAPRTIQADINIDLLGGAERKATRVRGFAPWNPQARTRPLLEQIKDVLNEYVSHLPLTIRQVFYRLVGVRGYEKTEGGYDRLCEVINRARRARVIDMDAIRDDGTVHIVPSGWNDIEDFLDTVRYMAKEFRLDRRQGQPTQIEMTCEAGGMAPQLAAAVDFHGIPVFSPGGFDSTTIKYDLAKRLADDGRDAEILHVGDQDPSGAHLFISFAEDVTAFAAELGVKVKFSRLAVTPDQIVRLNLETAPPKADDKRAFRGQTCQAEAIAPDVLAQIVCDAVEERVDQVVLRRVLAREKKLRRELVARFK